jgi:small conductance mechanosensitive channel
MKIDTTTAVRMTIIALWLTCGTPLVTAQDATPARSEQISLADEARSLLDRIEQTRAKGRELMARLEGQEGEDRLVTERELAESRVQVLQDLNGLVDNVLEQERQGLDTATLRGPLELLMQEVPPAIQRLIDAISDQLSELRAQRDDTEPTELPEREERIAEDTAYVDSLVQALLDHVEKMEALGLDGSKERTYLAESLTDRARSLTERIKIAQENKASLEIMLADTPDDAGLKLELDAASIRLEGTIANLTSTVEVMQSMDLETVEYRSQLIQATGDLSTDILDKEVALSLVGQWVSYARQWVADHGKTVVFKAVVFLFILLLFRILANIVRKLMIRSLASAKVKTSKLLADMITSIVSKIIMLFGLLVALSQMGIRLGPLLAGLGVAGFIVGFALQDTLSNFASGMMILFYRPFDEGDLVEAGGVFGRVSRMTLVSTTFLTLDHQTLVVPNSKIWGDVIKNVTAQEVRRVDMTFGISYADDIPHAERVLESILRDNAMVLDDPEPMVRLHNLGDSSVDFVVRPWVKTDDYWEAYWAVTREVKMRFDREAIGIPFPQRDVHFYEEKRATA